MIFSRPAHHKQFRVLLMIWSSVLLCGVSSAAGGPILPGRFYEFAFESPGVAASGCSPADPAGPLCIPSSGTPTLFADASPWTFVAPDGGGLLTVTDAFESGDRFEILNFGVVIGMTSVPVGGADCGDDPVPCLAAPAMSSGVFALAPGPYSLTIVPLTGDFGAGYFRVDADVIPEPATWLLFGVGAAALARQHLRRVAARRRPSSVGSS